MLDEPWFWVSLIIISVFLCAWLVFAIYNSARYQILQIFGYLMLVLGLVFTIGPYPPVIYGKYISSVLAYTALILIAISVAMTRWRWINRRGTEKLNSPSNLMIFAFVRHPITLAMMLIGFSVIVLKSSILSNVLTTMALVFFLLSSFEKDIYQEKVYGYPHKVYSTSVPRFNIITGLVKSIIIARKEKKNIGKQ